MLQFFCIRFMSKEDLIRMLKRVHAASILL